MKNYTILLLILFSLVSCSNDDENKDIKDNPCGFESLGIEVNAKYPLTPDSPTSVWNWKIINDTIKVQTDYYTNGFEVLVQTYYFKIEESCVTPLFVKQYYGDDTTYEEYRKADFDATIEDFDINENLKFRVNGFSNIYINDVLYVNPSNPNYNPCFFTSPNGNTDIWVMFNNNQGAIDYYDGFGF